MRKKYSKERKEKVLKKLEKGMPLRKISRIHNIPLSTVWQWGKNSGI